MAQKGVSSNGGPTKGLQYGPYVTGKTRFAVREAYVRDSIATLTAKKAVGAAKLDLALRGIALSPEHSGKRKPGTVLPINFDQLFDLVRDPKAFGDDVEHEKVLRLKRNWVREQIVRLEKLKLVRRVPRRGRAPELLVLRDDGSGAPFDSPDGSAGNKYVTVFGSLFATHVIRIWGAPELAFYFAAMVGENYERARQGAHGTRKAPIGGGPWFRQLWWFNDLKGVRPEGQVLLPFSVPTLERGLVSLVAQGLVAKTWAKHDPITKKRFRSGTHNLYINQFDQLDVRAGVLSAPTPVRQLRAVPDHADDDDEMAARATSATAE